MGMQKSCESCISNPFMDEIENIAVIQIVYFSSLFNTQFIGFKLSLIYIYIFHKIAHKETFSNLHVIFEQFVSEWIFILKIYTIFHSLNQGFNSFILILILHIWRGSQLNIHLLGDLNRFSFICRTNVSC